LIGRTNKYFFPLLFLVRKEATGGALATATKLAGKVVLHGGIRGVATMLLEGVAIVARANVRGLIELEH